MFSTVFKRITVLSLCAVFLVPFHMSNAEEHFYTNAILNTATFRWNNQNWFTEEHPKIAEFTVRDDGSAYGFTETGIPFSQENVENMLNVRIQRFVLEDHYHYIINGEVVYSLEEFSIQLAKAYRDANQFATS